MNRLEQTESAPVQEVAQPKFDTNISPSISEIQAANSNSRDAAQRTLDQNFGTPIIEGLTTSAAVKEAESSSSPDSKLNEAAPEGSPDQPDETPQGPISQNDEARASGPKGDVGPDGKPEQHQDQPEQDRQDSGKSDEGKPDEKIPEQSKPEHSKQQREKSGGNETGPGKGDQPGEGVPDGGPRPEDEGLSSEGHSDSAKKPADSKESQKVAPESDEVSLPNDKKTEIETAPNNLPPSNDNGARDY